MKVQVQAQIQAPIEKVWNTITDIQNSDKVISGINSVEILNQPENGLVGLKWKEERTFMNKTAEETMWITEAIENKHYNVRAESHGSIYLSTISVVEKNNGTLLSMDFSGKPQTLGAKIMLGLMGWIFKGATKKALQQDMNNIKAAVEQQ